MTIALVMASAVGAASSAVLYAPFSNEMPRMKAAQVVRMATYGAPASAPALKGVGATEAGDDGAGSWVRHRHLFSESPGTADVSSSTQERTPRRPTGLPQDEVHDDEAASANRKLSPSRRTGRLGGFINFLQKRRKELAILAGVVAAALIGGALFKRSRRAGSADMSTQTDITGADTADALMTLADRFQHQSSEATQTDFALNDPEGSISPYIPLASTVGGNSMI